jgi:uncharacterized protein (TIGR00661 family)
MARIVYGVMGDARGHVTRALTVAGELPQHEFLFVGGGRVHDLEARGYRVVDVPMASTLYRNNRVNLPATVINAAKVFGGGRKVVNRLAQVIAEFNPHLILTDYEYFTPLAARKLRFACVSIDHQHILTHCGYEIPSEQRLSQLMTNLSIRALYSNASHFIVVSFYKLPPKISASTEVLPPIIRAEVRSLRPVDGEHVLVYQTSPTYVRLFPLLEQTPNRYLIYGFGERPPQSNLVFRPYSNEGFLADLASCRYVVTNGGHNVVSEALFLGKPVLSLPIVNAFEQFLNAYFLARLGYGDYSTAPVPSLEFLRTFESRLEEFTANITRDDFLGNKELVARLESHLPQSKDA